MPTVFVIAKDWTLRAGVRAELREMGVDALGMETVADAGQTIAAGTIPDVVMLDAASEDVASLGGVASLVRSVPVLVVASRTEAVPGIETAAMVMYRPVSVGEVVARLKQLLEGQPA